MLFSLKQEAPDSIGGSTFTENYSDGFGQHFYGETVIGNGFASTVTVDIDKDAKDVRVTALRSSHDRPTDHQLPAKTQNSLRIGDDAHLKLTVNDHDTNDYTDGQLINATGAFLSETDFTIGNRMTVDTEQIGEPGRKGSASNKLTGLVGIFTRAVNDSHIGADLKNTVTVKNRNMEYVSGISFSGWMQDIFSGQMQDGIRPDDPTKDTSTVSIGAGSMNQIDVQNSIVGNGITAIEVDSDSHISLGEKSFSRIDVKDSIVGYHIIGIG